MSDGQNIGDQVGMGLGQVEAPNIGEAVGHSATRHHDEVAESEDEQEMMEHGGLDPGVAWRFAVAAAARNLTSQATGVVVLSRALTGLAAALSVTGRGRSMPPYQEDNRAYVDEDTDEREREDGVAEGRQPHAGS